MLEINGLNVFYGDYQALFEVTASVASGEIVSLLGANGAGKTTTINTICGFIRPRAGTIQFDGREIQKLPANRIVEKGLIQIPEERMLFPDMTVLENLQMGAYLERARKTLADSLDWVYGLFPVLKNRQTQLAGTLSGGEQQMLAMGRALMTSPKVLLLDEPSMGLAPVLVDDIFATIRQLHDAGTTILLVEQNARIALQTASRGYVLQSGSVVLSDTAENLEKNEMVREAYLGE